MTKDTFKEQYLGTWDIPKPRLSLPPGLSTPLFISGYTRRATFDYCRVEYGAYPSEKDTSIVFPGGEKARFIWEGDDLFSRSPSQSTPTLLYLYHPYDRASRREEYLLEAAQSRGINVFFI